MNPIPNDLIGRFNALTAQEQTLSRNMIGLEDEMFVFIKDRYEKAIATSDQDELQALIDLWPRQGVSFYRTEMRTALYKMKEANE